MSQVFIVILEHTVGCEAECTATEIKGVFTDQAMAEEFKAELNRKLKWNDYYEGSLNVYPFDLNKKIFG
jgi:hypothetical protein